MAIIEPREYMARIEWDDASGNDPEDAAIHTYHAMVVNGDRVGMVKVQPHGTGAMISNLWVHPDHRRKGYGSALLVGAVQRYGAQHLYVRPEPFDGGPSVDALISLYANLGFEGPVTGMMYRTGK